MYTKQIVLIAGLFIATMLITIALANPAKNVKTRLIYLLIANLVYAGSVFYFGFGGNDLITILLTLALLDFCTIRVIYRKVDVDEERYKQWHDDPKNWKLGLFYFNREDKRIFPPKRFEGMGWTINFANADSILVMMTIIAMIVIVINALNIFR
jgi:uncharacterized membrane protein